MSTVPANLFPRLRRLLFRLRPLEADRAGQWSVRVSGDQRAVFRIEDSEAVAVELADYH